MSDEFERLRDVARAAAVLVTAQDEWLTACGTSYESAADPNGEKLRGIQLRSQVYYARLSELTASVARLAELDPSFALTLHSSERVRQASRPSD